MKKKAKTIAIIATVLTVAIFMVAWVVDRGGEMDTVGWSPMFESRVTRALTGLTRTTAVRVAAGQLNTEFQTCDDTCDATCGWTCEDCTFDCELVTMDTCGANCEDEPPDNGEPPQRVETDTMEDDCWEGERERERQPTPKTTSGDIDCGDAPDDPINPNDYPTRIVSNGARHLTGDVYYLGALVDADPDGYESPFAQGDDIIDRIDDEDGVTFETPLIRGSKAAITVVASTGGYLDAWIDFNADRDWADPGEQVFAGYRLYPGVNMLLIEVPYTAVAEPTFSRFRFSSRGGLPYFGGADDGEVEDYWVLIR